MNPVKLEILKKYKSKLFLVMNQKTMRQMFMFKVNFNYQMNECPWKVFGMHGTAFLSILKNIDLQTYILLVDFMNASLHLIFNPSGTRGGGQIDPPNGFFNFSKKISPTTYNETYM